MGVTDVVKLKLYCYMAVGLRPPTASLWSPQPPTITSGREASLFPPPSLSKGSAKISTGGGAAEHLSHWPLSRRLRKKSQELNARRINMKPSGVLVLSLLASLHVFTPGRTSNQALQRCPPISQNRGLWGGGASNNIPLS